ncbi:unnamed protein product [Paramecium primaurelia]|uniref:Uncharacterized protein n=1 Tax=Paramecium primaurelia TaxID=5886 RepID=A0A8S1PXC2_PARPR|nr:unnamed protein product [Paramecium primaurelia]
MNLYKQLLNSSKTDIRRLANEGKNFKCQIRELDGEYYANRIIALKAENDTAQTIRNQSSIAIQISKYKLMSKFIRSQTIQKIRLRLVKMNQNSGRDRSNNPSIISSKSLENMHQKLSHLYKNYSVNYISKIKNFSNYAVEKYEDFNQKSQGYHIISNSFIKWKKKAQQIKKVKTNNNIQYSQSMIIYFVYSQDYSSIISLMGKNKIKVNQEDKSKTQSSYRIYKFKNNLITKLNEIDCFYSTSRFQKKLYDYWWQKHFQKENSRVINQIYDYATLVKLSLIKSRSDLLSIAVIDLTISDRSILLYKIVFSLLTLNHLKSLNLMIYLIKNHIVSKAIIQNYQLILKNFNIIFLKLIIQSLVIITNLYRYQLKSYLKRGKTQFYIELFRINEQ